MNKQINSKGMRKPNSKCSEFVSLLRGESNIKENPTCKRSS